ncbi:MAG: DNA translocase FtsK [Candidatus Omnitrophica bacterium]|nr:DNA translocase FtsK [Candidatus Omnitrophota bacterium]
MKEEHLNEIKAVAILAVSVIIFASLFSYTPDDLIWYTSTPNIPAHNLVNITGAYLAGILFFAFGYTSYFFGFYLLYISWNKFCSRKIRFSLAKIISLIVLCCVISSFFALSKERIASDAFQRGGFIGMMTARFLMNYFGFGAYVILLTLGVLSLILTGEFLVTPFFQKVSAEMGNVFASLKEKMQNTEKPQKADKAGIPEKQSEKPKIDLAAQIQKKFENEGAGNVRPLKEDKTKTPNPPADVKTKNEKSEQLNIKIVENKRDAVAEKEAKTPKVYGTYRLPPLDLLESAPQIPNSKIQSDIVDGAKTLETSLANFGVNAKVVDVERGPAITRYELEPAPGVKVQKFTALADDIALVMKVAAVRVVAPIPGKNRVGIEVPNTTTASVFLKDVLMTKEFQNAKSKLTIALGKDLGGQPIVADLATMPHLLIAGTTGSGKSVCVNGIVMSILCNATPDEVKFVMVDPKMVEMAIYNEVPHMLCPTVTDTKKAGNVLNWVVGEMESRYKKLAKDNVKNILQYNEKPGNHMHYIVLIVDELADLMMVSAKTVESSITRIAQLARAVGIHVILATQRPSVDVITGVIKANFPARISFKVASKVDSRTVLDMNGAEALLGRGDMLFIKPGDAKPVRGQGNYVKDEEIRKVIDYIKPQRAPEFDETILTQQKSASAGDGEAKDEYFDEAVKLVMETNQASVSILQRRMKLGYTRAARLIDMMEQEGVVGPYCGSKPRDILVDREQWLLDHMNPNSDLEIKELG